MRRLLFVGLEVPKFSSISWSEWATSNPLDYQGLVLDCRNTGALPPEGAIASTLLPYVTNGHPVYVILPKAAAIGAFGNGVSLLPGFRLQLSRSIGKTLQVRRHSPDTFFPFYVKVLEAHEIFFTPVLIHNHAQRQWAATVVDNISRPVCGIVDTVYLLHPPSEGFEQKALKIIIEHFKPDFPAYSTTPKPEWVDRAASILPGVAAVQSKKKLLEDEIREKMTLNNSLDKDLLDITGWADLLWFEGMALQEKVAEAFTFLGITILSPDSTGHTCDLKAIEPEADLVFEVTGSTGAIGIQKGRQLLQWASEADDPDRSKEILVGNAFRELSPESRPPSKDHKIFVSELEKFAERYHLALLDVRELYRVVSLKLASQVVSRDAIVAGLLKDGIVRFEL